MEEDKLLQDRKRKLIDFIKGDKLTSAFIILAIISFLFFVISGTSFLNTIPFPPLQMLLSIIHSLDEFFLFFNGWLLLALFASLSAILSYYKKTSYVFYPLVTWIVWLSTAIRILPLKINPATGKPGLWDITRDTWTLGPDLDPFLFLRWAQEIITTGALSAVDIMRYVPLGFDVKEELVLHSYLIVWFHKIAIAFGSPSIEFSAIIYPVFMFALAIIAFYFFVRKVFVDEVGEIKASLIALLSSFLFTLIPSILPRTVAGIPEKEASGFPFLFAAFYFFLSAWKAKSAKSRYINSILAALSTSLMALVWGGYIYIYISISIAVGIAFLLGQTDKDKFYLYSLWLFLSMIIIAYTTNRFTFLGLLTSLNTGIATGVFGILLVHFIMTQEKSAWLRSKLEKLKINKIPDQVIAICLVIIFMVLASFFVGGSFLTDKAKGVVNQFVSPTTDRLGVTVAENRQPFFDEWASSFGPSLLVFAQYVTFNKIAFPQSWSAFPIFFWLFFLGSIYVVFYMTRASNIKERAILTGGYLVFLFGVVFSRYKPSSILNGTSSMSLFVYALGFFALLFVLGRKGNEELGKTGTYYKASAIALFFLFIWINYYKNSLFFMFIALAATVYFGLLSIIGLAKQENLKSVDWGLLLIFSLFFISIVSARGAIRLVMMLGPPAVIMVSSACVILTSKIFSMNLKKGFLRVISIVFIVLLLSMTAFSGYAFFEGIKSQARSEVPYSYTFQWQKAMGWVRGNTPKNAVFGHWWDYGYWLQSMGERASVLDGGNAIPYWNHLMGRYALTGPDSQTALDYLYAHNTTHFLIDSTDIGKYSAFSSIGSDLNSDRASFIPSMIRSNGATKELKNSTKFYYFPTGNKYESVLPLDADIKYSANSTNITLMVNSAIIVGISVELDNSGKLIKQPEEIFIYKKNNGQQAEESFPMRYLYFDGNFTDFGSGIESGAFFMQKINSDGNSFNLESNGALLYLSKKTVKSQLARLYLYKEDNPYFKLVRTQDSPIVEQSKLSGATGIEDVLFYGGVQGPIRIWQINYPSNMTLNRTYLSKEFSDPRLAR